MGDELYALALPLVLLFLGYNGSVVTFVFGVLMASTVGAGFVVGVVVDRYPAHTVVTGSYLVSAAIMLCAAAAFAVGISGYAVALIGAAVLGMFAAASAAAVDAGVARTVKSPAAVGRGYSLVESARTASTVLGPPLGGLVASSRNLTAVLGINAGSFLVAAVTSGSRRRPGGPVPERVASAGRQVVEGLKAVRDNSALRLGIAMSLLLNVTLGAEQPLFLTRLVKDLGQSPLQTSLTVTVAAVVSIAVALLLGRLAPALPTRTAMTWSSAVSAATAVGIGLTRSVLASTVLYCGLVASNICYNVFWRTYRQQVVLPALLGRVSATSRSLAYSGVVVGVVATGLLQRAGVQTSMLFTAGGLLCSGGLAAWFCVGRARSGKRRR